MTRILLLLCAVVACATSDGAPTENPPPVTGTVDTVFAEGFESGSFAVWQDRGSPQNHAIINDPARAKVGNRFLEVTYPVNDNGGWLTHFFMPGYDTIYVGYWVKLEAGWIGGTKFLLLWGSRTDDQWSASGKAGACPTGTDFFATTLLGVNQAVPFPVHFYTYYPGMPRESDGVTCYGNEGLSAATYTQPTFTVGTWHYVEFLVMLNTPGQSNYRQMFWIDGVLRGDWSGLSVRASNILKLNAVTLSNSAAGQSVVRKMLVDDILVARQRPGGL